MGWTYTYKPPGLSVHDFFRQQFNGNGYEVIDCASRLTEAYLAVRHPRGYVFAVVCLLHRKPKDDYNFGYKDMDETMGPNADNCPKRILKLLTPLDEIPLEYRSAHKFDESWRNRCWAKINRPKPKKGQVVKFSHPITFTRGAGSDDTFIYCGRNTFEMYGNRKRVRIGNWKTREYAVVS